MGALRPGLATALDCSGVRSPCINDDTFWPHAGPTRFESVGSTETVAGRHLGFGLVASYLSRPIVLQLQSPGNGSQQYVINDQVNGTFLWSYGVSDRLELDLALPVTFGQSGAGLAPVTGGGGLHDTAVRDMRFGFTYAAIRHALVPAPSNAAARPADGWGLAGRLEVSAPTGDQDQFAGERAGVFAPGISTDLRVGLFFAGAEVGARIRPTGELLGSRVGSQIVAALGVGVDILPRQLLAAALEAWALPTLVGQRSVVLEGGTYTSQPNDKSLVPAEWQLSVRTAPLARGDLSFQLGGGGALPLSGDSAMTTPRFRFVLGIRWEPLVRRPEPGHEPAAESH